MVACIFPRLRSDHATSIGSVAEQRPAPEFNLSVTSGEEARMSRLRELKVQRSYFVPNQRTRYNLHQSCAISSGEQLWFSKCAELQEWSAEAAAILRCGCATRQTSCAIAGLMTLATSAIRIR